MIADIDIKESGGVFTFQKKEDSLKKYGCKDEIEACRTEFLSKSGEKGEVLCTAFKKYQSCYYGHVQHCGILEVQLQNKQFVEARTDVFKADPKCAVSTTPWDSSLGISSGSQISGSWSGYQGSSPNSILSDSGSGVSGEEPSGPISGSMGLYMNVGQWIVLASCCCLCCAACGVAVLCHPRTQRELNYACEDDYDFDDFMAPAPVAMYPQTMQMGTMPMGGFAPSMGPMPTTYFPQ